MSGAAGRPLVLEVAGLATEFSTRAGTLKAVDGVSLTLGRGEIMGLVGESGSGKSVTGYSIMGLVEPPGRIVAGSVKVAGTELVGLSREALRQVRGARIAMVFQDPMMTLNPVLTVGEQMILALRAHARIPPRTALVQAREALAVVGIPSPEARLAAYPHQLSGGMRQRVAIAMALMHRPDVVIADEPTTALDVSIQSQILAEVKRLAGALGTAFLWITHDLAVVSALADRIAIMYAGRIVEEGPAEAVIAVPRHPYTHGLLASVPAGSAPGSRLPQIDGQAPAPINLPDGCRFRPRCARADAACGAMPTATVDDGLMRSFLCHHPLAQLAGGR
ncbi:MAG: ABC transporter ATP-binding protein [Hyphomicrobiaceae bacterium]